jgi:CARDB protein
MNTRHFLRMSVVVLLLLPTPVFAQTPTRDQGLPDLVVADLSVDKDCRIVVTIQNNGPGAVPAAGYSMSPPGSSGVQMYKGGAPWGGIVLGGLDPSHLSQPAGGTVSFMFPRLVLPPGTHAVQIDVDNNNSIAESNELNNSLTEKLACQQPLPDLVVADLSLDTDCRIDVTIRNSGLAAESESGYSLSPPDNSGVQMYNDGAPWGQIVLGGFDPAPHLSQPVGGRKTYKWFSTLPLPAGSHTVKLDVDNNNSIAESNEGNNSLTKTLNCLLPLPDLEPTNISLQSTSPVLNSPCRIILTVANNGGIVPDAAYVEAASSPTIQMYKGAGGWGGAVLSIIDRQKVLQPAGATFTNAWMGAALNLLLPPGDHTLRVEVDINNALVESNEANNSLTKTLTCGLIIAPATTNP